MKSLTKEEEQSLTEKINAGEVKVINDGASGEASAFGGTLGIGGAPSVSTPQSPPIEPSRGPTKNGL